MSDSEMLISDQSDNETPSERSVNLGQRVKTCHNLDNDSKNSIPFAEAAKLFLGACDWKRYPPLLSEQMAFNEEQQNEEADRLAEFDKYFSSNSEMDTILASPRPSFLHADLDFREAIFTKLQNFASTRRTFQGPLTQGSVDLITSFSATVTDDALSNDDTRIYHAMNSLYGDLNSVENVVGELTDEKQWDIAESAALDCIDSVTSKVAQEVDFYSRAPGVDRGDPVFSMILAETDWLLYEMVSYLSDEPADLSLYVEHFYGPSEEEKKKRKAIEMQLKKELERKQEEEAAKASMFPISSEIYQTVIPAVQERHFGYNYIAPPQEELDPAAATLWQNYYECQHQAAYVQAAAFSYSAKMHAHQVVAHVNANYPSPQRNEGHKKAAVNTTQGKSKSLAVKFVQSALKTKSLSSPVSNSKETDTNISKSEEKNFPAQKSEKTSRTENNSRDVRGSSRRQDYDKHRGSKRRHAESVRDEKEYGPFYCMVTNIRNDARTSEIEAAAERVGRIDSVRVLRDKVAKPPDNALASITYRYVYKNAFEKLLSTGLYFYGKHRPIARLQSDPFSSS